MDSLDDQRKGPIPPSPKQRANAPDEPMRHELLEKFGVDLTAVEGVSLQTALTFLGEVGTSVGKFPTAEHFASWPVWRQLNLGADDN